MLTRRQSVDRVEQEIRQAKAEALGRAGERLDVALARLRALDGRLDALRDAAPEVGLDRDTLRAETEARNRVREEALDLLRNLIIQREALGLANHDAVSRLDPIPEPRRI